MDIHEHQSSAVSPADPGPVVPLGYFSPNERPHRPRWYLHPFAFSVWAMLIYAAGVLAAFISDDPPTGFWIGFYVSIMATAFACFLAGVISGVWGFTNDSLSRGQRWAHFIGLIFNLAPIVVLVLVIISIYLSEM